MLCSDMISAAQIRAARALLDWQRQRLVNESGVSHSTISDYEKGRTKSMLTETARKLIDAFGKAGVEFVYDGQDSKGAGVRFKKASE